MIDTHAFYGHNEPVDTTCTLDQLRKLHGKYGVSFLVVSACPENNGTVIDAVQRADFLHGAYLWLTPKEHEKCLFRYTSAYEIDRYAQRPVVIGLKLLTSAVFTSVDEKCIDEFCEIGADRDLPLLIHCSRQGTDYTSYEKNKRLAGRHPKLKIILAHFGGLNPDYTEGAKQLARDFPNIYLNTTGFSGEIKSYDAHNGYGLSDEGNANKNFWQKTLSESMQDPKLRENILFGTDYPWLEFSLHPYDKLSEKDQAQLDENAKRLFNL